MKTTKDKFQPLVDYVSGIAKCRMMPNTGHDMNHLHRVCRLARKLLCDKDTFYPISGNESFGRCIEINDNLAEASTIVASYFHDIADYSEDHPEAQMNGARTIMVAKREMNKSLLSKAIREIGFQHTVEENIDSHSLKELVSFAIGQCKMGYSRSESGPVSVVSAVIQDAHYIDSIGVVGISKMIVNSSLEDQDIYNPTDPFSRKRYSNRENAKYLFNQIKCTKTGIWAEKMNTPLGTRMVKKRLLNTYKFFENFAEEIDEVLPDSWFPRF